MKLTGSLKVFLGSLGRDHATAASSRGVLNPVMLTCEGFARDWKVRDGLVPLLWNRAGWECPNCLVVRLKDGKLGVLCVLVRVSGGILVRFRFVCCDMDCVFCFWGVCYVCGRFCVGEVGVIKLLGIAMHICITLLIIACLLSSMFCSGLHYSLFRRNFFSLISHNVALYTTSPNSIAPDTFGLEGRAQCSYLR